MVANVRLMIVLAVLALTCGESYCQPVLLGCTGNTTSTGPTSRIVTINPLTGLAINPRDTGIAIIGGIATQPSTGKLYGLTTFASTPANTLVTFDVLTGTPTIVGPTGLTNIVEGDLAFNPISGALFGLQYTGPTSNQRSLFRIDPGSGTAAIIGSSGATLDLSAMAFDSVGTLYVIDSASRTSDALLVVDPLTATFVSSKPLNVNLSSAVGMAINPFTGEAFVADGAASGQGILYSLNLNSGALTAIGPTGATGGIVGLTFTSVPEPKGLAILASVFVVATGCRWGSRLRLR